MRQSKPLVITPLDNAAIQPASVDLRLGNSMEGIYPSQFLLASTLERVEIPDWLCATVWGRSSTARRGLFIHITAGLIDPGYKGNITLELYNASTEYIPLTYGMGISQLIFDRLETPTDRPYGSDGLGSKYQNSEGIVGPKE